MRKKIRIKAQQVTIHDIRQKEIAGGLNWVLRDYLASWILEIKKPVLQRSETRALQAEEPANAKALRQKQAW